MFSRVCRVFRFFLADLTSTVSPRSWNGGTEVVLTSFRFRNLLNPCDSLSFLLFRQWFCHNVAIVTCAFLICLVSIQLEPVRR